MAKKRRSYPKSANKWKIKFDLKDTSILKIKWKSPNDEKENTLNIKNDFKDKDTIKIKDNH